MDEGAPQVWHHLHANNIRKYLQMKEVLTAILLLNQVKKRNPLLNHLTQTMNQMTISNLNAKQQQRQDQVEDAEYEEVQDLKGKRYFTFSQIQMKYR